jgi:histidinol-phosphate aminotransferase
VRFQRELLKDVEGYVPGEQMNDPGIIKLNTNENPYPPTPRATDALRAIDPTGLRKYPDPVAVRFRELGAERFGLPGADWLVAGNGSDELLSLILRTFVDPGDDVVANYPTYTLYEILAQLHGCTLRYIPSGPNYELTEEHFATTGRVFFLTRPNAPTGVSSTREEVARLCENFPGIVVIDEAYADFADDDCMDFVLRFDNVIVLRTFSKSFSLAGMRIGLAAARPEIIREFMKTKDSYNLNAVGQAVGIAALEDYAYMQEQAAKVKATRTQLVADLTALGFLVPPSQANFVLAKWAGSPDAKTIFQTLRDRKILVRYFDAEGLRDALRITVGTDEECAALISALKSVIPAKAGI